MSTATIARSNWFARELARVRDESGLTAAQVARAVGVKPGTVHAWSAGTRQPRGSSAERIAELTAIVDRLGRVVDRGYIGFWLLKPSPGLGERSPVDALADGDYRSVSRLLANLEDPPAA